MIRLSLVIPDAQPCRAASSRRSNPSCGRIMPRRGVGVRGGEQQFDGRYGGAFRGLRGASRVRPAARRGGGTGGVVHHNRGLREAQAPLVAFIDDDERVNEGFLRAYLRILRNPSRGRRGRGGASSPNTPRDVRRGCRNTSKCRSPIRWISESGCVQFPAGRVPGGGNMAFRRAGLAGYGGFDPTLGRVNGELIGGEENDFFEHLPATAARRSGMCRGR